MRTLFLLAALGLGVSAATAEIYESGPVDVRFEDSVPPGRRAMLGPLTAVYVPRIVEALGADYFDVRGPITFAQEDEPIAAAALTLDRHITYNNPYVDKNSEDAPGLIIHELTHVVQQYGSNPVPVWLTEGITDYLRYYVLLPDPARRADPLKADYRKGYQHAALLLDYLIRTRHGGDYKALIHPLNAACRSGSDPLVWLEQTYGMTPDAIQDAVRAEASAAQKP